MKEMKKIRKYKNNENEGENEDNDIIIYKPEMKLIYAIYNFEVKKGLRDLLLCSPNQDVH